MKRRAHYINFLFRNINVLNSVLLIVIIFATGMISPVFSTKRLYSLPSIRKSVAPDKQQPPGATTPSSSDFLIIADKNLFHPDRKIPPEKKAEEEKPLPRPDVVLYGTLITDTTSIAYLEDLRDPRNTPGRGKRQLAMKKGDLLSGFTVEKINADSVVLARGKEKMTVAVSDSHRRVKSGVTAQAALGQTPNAKAAEPVKLPEVHRPPPRSHFDATIYNFLDAGRNR